MESLGSREVYKGKCPESALQGTGSFEEEGRGPMDQLLVQLLLSDVFENYYFRFLGLVVRS